MTSTTSPAMPVPAGRSMVVRAGPRALEAKRVAGAAASPPVALLKAARVMEARLEPERLAPAMEARLEPARLAPAMEARLEPARLALAQATAARLALAQAMAAQLATAARLALARQSKCRVRPWAPR